MTERVKAFVENWKKENLHPAAYEPQGDQTESKANAQACLDFAVVEGITKAEIEEEYENLVADMALSHERFIDRDIKRLVEKEN